MPTFVSAAQAVRKVQVVFSEAMTIDAEYTNAANYTVTKTDGTSVAVSTVTPIDNQHVELTLGADLVLEARYALQIGSNVTTAGAQSLSPDTFVFQFFRNKPIRLGFEHFTGEVTSGLLGTPAGQVFFSPALEVDTANSSIQIDSVSVCTRAFDVYEIPEIPDPPYLYTYPSPDAVATSSLLNMASLFASAARMGLARTDLVDAQTDTYTAPTDGPADATLVETIDITTGGFLNDDRWRTYPGTGASLGTFTTADNSTPIGSGGTTNINLQA